MYFKPFRNGYRNDLVKYLQMRKNIFHNFLDFIAANENLCSTDKFRSTFMVYSNITKFDLNLLSKAKKLYMYHVILLSK